MKDDPTISAPAIQLKLRSAIPAEQYEVVGVLGQGGAGTVFKAQDRRSGRTVAIKVVFPWNKEALDRVQREVDLLSRLSQAPHILPLLQTFSSPEGDAIGLVLPYVDGTSAEGLVTQAGCGLPDNIVASISRQAGEALAVAHAANIVHRDIKPSNVLIPTDGNVMLCDFGIAAPISQTRQTRLTTEGNFVGTIRYAAPEVISGRDFGPAVDVYALGVTILFMLLGRQPLEDASIPFLVQQIVSGAIINELPAERRPKWGDLLAAMLSPDPAGRPTARDLVSRLGTLLPGEPEGERAQLARFVAGRGNLEAPPPPTVLSAAPQPADDSLRGLVNTLAAQIDGVHAAVADITARYKRSELRRGKEVREGVVNPEDGIGVTFANVRRRLELNWRLSLLMTGVLFSLFVALLVLAVVFGLVYQKSYWGIIFGGTSGLSLLTVVVWKPMDKMLLSTIATQQLELIQLNYQRAIVGNREERREAFRDVSTQLTALLTKLSSKGR